ncbi:MAG TPA: hypothetical protein DCY94_01500 [Firmicutes bacterium]|nr:hypothetical protein [Bacillota bacterium]
MNIRNRFKTFNFRTTVTIVLFSIFILLLLYFCQNIYLNYYYEVYKIDQVESIANKISSQEDLNEYFAKVSNEVDVCIKYVGELGVVSYNEDTKGCLLNSQNAKIDGLMKEMYQSENETMFYRITNPRYNTKSFLFGMRLGNAYVFINSQLETMDETNRALKNQVVYLLIIVIFLSIVIASFISRNITKPIFEITKKARKLGKGDYSVVFEKSGIDEIDELSDTLNNAKNEMQKTDDYRRDLMANVGHDLKTPLTLIKSYAEMVRDITYKDDTKRDEHLNVIINETDRLNELVCDIIELSKLEASAEDLKIERFDLVAEIKNTISKFEILELTENYNFVYEGLDKAFIYADRKKMGQVIYNLINNAVNYTGDDQTVYVKTSKVKDGIKIEIIDTGKGIDEETIKYVWNRYYKTEKKHKRNKVGTGLGLSIVREILEAHGFKYGVESKIGSGTNFYFIIGKNKRNEGK